MSFFFFIGISKIITIFRPAIRGFRKSYIVKLYFIKSELFRRILASEKVTREFRFTFEADASEFIVDAPNERLLIQGAVDCIFEENGKCIVLDYKTDRIRENLTEKIEYYSPQLQIYARALKELTGKEVSEGILYFLDADEAVRIW